MFIAGRPPFPHASPNAGRCEWSSGLSRATRGLHYISWHRCSTAQDRGLPRDLTRTLPFMLVFSRRVAKIPPQSCPSDLSRTSSRGFEIEAGLKLIQVTTRKSEGANQKVQIRRCKSEGTRIHHVRLWCLSRSKVFLGIERIFEPYSSLTNAGFPIQLSRCNDSRPVSGCFVRLRTRMAAAN
jgi:hypothetical protein